MNHLILGAGAAGISAARTILKEKLDDTVVMVSEDREVYSRCMLHRFISGERDAESLNFVNDGLLKNSRFRWIGGKTITRLDGAAKTVYAGDEKVASGDTVLIATGANSVSPPIGELRTAKNAFGLRHLSDARSITECAKKAEKIAVIGAGLVGLDAAYALLELGKKLSIVEMAETVLAINLDAHAALAYQRRFEEKGAAFYLGRKVVNTRSDGAGGITALELDSGTVVPCDMVIVAVGVRPATGFLAESGVKAERAVAVDDRLATNIPGIYAAGDVAGLSGIWPNAVKQGEVAGENMCGVDYVYEDRFAAKNTVNFFGLLSLSVGAVNPQEGDTVLIREDRFNYKKLILRDGAPAGLILQGNIAGSGFWQHLVKNKIRIDNRGKSPWKISYADFFGVENNGEYKWVV
ncbi:MAG: FAD-dependent oxidoreductase [Treponema sp.]|jgi:NAD(P)H-nitrite reductase large subunit|nr:FAD-dependent oxidoreductase [Treponema sp.]